MLVCQYPGIAAATLAIGVGSVMATRSAASEELPTRTLEVYRVATPPVLDGERNYPCWQVHRRAVRPRTTRLAPTILSR